MTELSKDEVARRRAQVECKDYIPLRRNFRCQHYLDSGACRRDDYIMCVEWLKKNPDQEIPTRKPEVPREAQSSARVTRSAQAPGDRQLRLPPSALPGERTGVVYNLASLGKVDPVDEKHILLEQPELLTEQAVEQLSQQGYEVTVTTVDGDEITLVPEYTDAERAELRYRDARTLVMVMSVFHGSAVNSLSRPDKDKEAS